MSRAKHPSKEIEAAVRYAESHGWKVIASTGHAWGKIYCPYNSPECRGGTFCKAGVWSTPKSNSNHADQLNRVVNNCTMHKAKNAGHQQNPDAGQQQ